MRKIFNNKMWFLVLMLVVFAAGCGSSGGGNGSSDTTAPTVSYTIPLDLATGVVLNSTVNVTFSEVMNAATLTTATFTLKKGATSITGTVAYAGTTATFKPASNLTANTVYTATVTTGVTDLAGNALAANKVWSFTTGTTIAAGPTPVILGSAGNYVILAKAAISTTGTTAVTGNIGLSPAAATYITGFSLVADATNVFSTSPQVTGQIFAADYADPTPANLTTAVLDMMTAYTDAAGRAPDHTELGAGNIGGMTLAPGVYKWGTGVLIPTDVTLSGGPDDVWIFEIAQDLVMSSGMHVNLSGGAQAKNIFWQVFGIVDLGTTAHFEGIALVQTAITLRTGAAVNGRLLAQTAVTLDAATVTQP
jgi:Ice-binding-like/Bacterial Ig-like domain